MNGNPTASLSHFGADLVVTLANDATIDDDGWALIAPFGEHESTRLYMDKTVKRQKFIQVLDNESVDTLENAFFHPLNRISFGLPIFKGNGDLNDHDPVAIGNTHEKIKIGVMDKVRKGTRGLEGHFLLDNDGAESVEGGWKYPSVLWRVTHTGTRGDVALARPFKLVSVALVKSPNISGVESLADSTT